MRRRVGRRVSRRAGWGRPDNVSRVQGAGVVPGPSPRRGPRSRTPPRPTPPALQLASRGRGQLRQGQPRSPDGAVLVGLARGVEQLRLLAGGRQLWGRRGRRGAGGHVGRAGGLAFAAPPCKMHCTLPAAAASMSGPPPLVQQACLDPPASPVVNSPTSQPARASAVTLLSGSAAVACIPPDSALAMYSWRTCAPVGGAGTGRELPVLRACRLLAGLGAAAAQAAPAPAAPAHAPLRQPGQFCRVKAVPPIMAFPSSSSPG